MNCKPTHGVLKNRDDTKFVRSELVLDLSIFVYPINLGLSLIVAELIQPTTIQNFYLNEKKTATNFLQQYNTLLVSRIMQKKLPK